MLIVVGFSCFGLFYGCGLGSTETRHPTWKQIQDALGDFAITIPQQGEPRYLYSVEGLKGNYKFVRISGDGGALSAWLQALKISEDEISACEEGNFHLFGNDPPAWKIAEPWGEFSCGGSVIPSRVDGEKYPWLGTVFINKQAENLYEFYVRYVQSYD